MDYSPVTHQDDTVPDPGSDYGSDFTAEEEDLVNELLAKLPSQQDSSSSLAVTNLEDDEEPGAAKVSRILGRERRNRSGTPLSTVNETDVPIEIYGNGSTADGENSHQVPETRLTDHQALS